MATPVTVTIPHKLGKAEARARIDRSIGDFKRQLASAGLGQMHEHWAEDRMHFTAGMLGQSISGRLEVRAEELRIEVDLPAFLAGLADKIAGRLQKQGRLLLEKK